MSAAHTFQYHCSPLSTSTVTSSYNIVNDYYYYCQSAVTTHKSYRRRDTVSSSRTRFTRACRRSRRIYYFSLVFRIFSFRVVQTLHFRRAPIQTKRRRFFALIRPVTDSTINPFQTSSDCKITINVLEETYRYSPRIRFNVFFVVPAQ